MTSPHCLPRMHSDALRILARPEDYPPTLVTLARAAHATMLGRPLPQRSRATRRIPAPGRLALPVTLAPIPPELRRAALRLIDGGRA